MTVAEWVADLTEAVESGVDLDRAVLRRVENLAAEDWLTPARFGVEVRRLMAARATVAALGLTSR